jgi:tape measure domain-containing protein
VAAVGELQFDFTLNANSVGSAFSQVESRVGQLESKLKSVGQSGLTGFNTTEFDRSIDTSKSKVGGLGDAIKGVIGFAAGFGVFNAAAQAVGSAWNFAKDSIIGFNDLQNGALKGFTSMLGSGEQAQQMLSQLKVFAAQTPFEFQGLIQSSQQLMAFGVAADQVIPLLTDIGNAAAYFHTGQQGIDQMTYALGQMNAAVTLHTQDLYQMLNAGVPVWAILSEGLHKSVPEVQEMVSKGQIASSTFIELFDTWARAPERADQMVQANKTLEGSMSTVHDEVQSLLADAFHPLYDMLTNLANKAAAWLSSDSFTAFHDAAVSAVQSVIDAFGKIPDAIQAAFAYITEHGGVAGALVALGGQVLDWIGGLANDLLGSAPDWAKAGATLIETFAQGMWDAVQGTVQGVVNAIADFIGGFFIGNSPPPTGPLSTIDDAGRTLMSTYVEGMKGGLDGLSSIPDTIQEVLTQFDPSKILADAEAAIHGTGVSLEDVKAAASDAADAMEAINGASKELDFQIDDLKMKMADMAAPYDVIIDKLKDQLDLMNQQRDWALEMNDLQLQLSDNQIRTQMHNDPALKNAQAQLKAAQDAAKGIGSGSASPAEQQQLLNLQKQLQAIPNDKAHAADRAHVQAMITGLQNQTKQQSILSQSQKEQAQASVDAAQKNYDAIKNTYQARLDDVAFQKEGVDLTKQNEDINKKIAELPLEQQEQAATQAKKDALAPMQAQLDALNRQKAQLDAQKKVWQDISDLVKTTASDMEKAQKAQEAAAKKAAGPSGGGVGGAAKPGAIGGGGINIPHQSLIPSQEDINKATDSLTSHMADTMKVKAKEIGARLLEGLGSYIRDNWGRLLLGFIGGTIGANFGPIGSIIGSAIGSHFGPELQKRIESVNWQDVMSRVASLWQTIREGAENAYTRLTALWKQAEPQLREIWDNVSSAAVSMFKGIKDGVEQIWPTIQGQFLPTLAKIAGILLEVVLPAAMRFIGWWVSNVEPTLANFYTTILAGVVDGLIAFGEWLTGTGIPAAQAFFGWLNDNALPPLEAIGTFVSGTILPALSAFGGWLMGTGLPAVQAFFGWIGDQAGPILTALGTWITANVMPVLQALGAYFQTNLQPILQAFGDWLSAVALPAVMTFFGWLRDQAGPIIQQVGNFFKTELLPAAQTALAWFTGELLPRLVSVFGSMGAAAETLAKLVGVAWTAILEGAKIAWPLIQAIIEAAWNTIKTLINVALPIITTVISDGWETVSNITTTLWNGITGIISGALKVIQGGFDIFSSVFQGDWSGAWNGVKEVLNGVWQIIESIITTALGLIGNVISATWTSITDGVRLSWNTVSTIISGVWNDINLAIGGVLGTIENAIGDSWKRVQAIFSGSKDALQGMITGAFSGAKDALGGIMSGLLDAVKGPFQSVANGIHSVLGGLRSGVNWLAGKFDLPEIGPVPDITWAAQGVSNFKGGPAIVGERGWELAIIDGKPQRVGVGGPELIPDLPKHATIVPHDISEKIVGMGAIPGFAFGLNFDWLGNVADVMKHGASWVWSQMVDHFVKIPQMDTKVFGDLAGSLVGWIKDNVISWIKGGLDKVIPVSSDQMTSMINFADSQQGLPYIWGGGHGGGGGPGIGFDCSGFVAAVLDAGGIPNPHGIVTNFYEWMKDGRSGVVDIGIINPYGAPDEQHTGIGLMGQWYESGGRAGGAGKTADYFPMVGHPPNFPDNAKGGGADAAVLAWTNILGGVVGQASLLKQMPPIWALPDALEKVQKTHSLANGGILNEPVDGVGRWTGATYEMGERGREAVSPLGSQGAAGQGITIAGDVNVNVTPPDGTDDPDEWGSAAGRAFVTETRRLTGRA